MVLSCSEDHPRQLFAALAVGDLDFVLSDIPLLPGIDVRATSQTIGHSTSTLFAEPVTIWLTI